MKSNGVFLLLAVLAGSCRPADMYEQNKWLPYEDPGRDPAFFLNPPAYVEVHVPLNLPEVAQDSLPNGSKLYGIYCVPCHSYLGDGNGMIAQRSSLKPPTFHSPRLRQAPDAHFDNVMANGLGSMPSYRQQLKTADRRAVIRYVRALQLSQNMKFSDLSPAERKEFAKYAAP